MTADLIVVRHGETAWNVDARLQGQTDIPLNARGRDQADAVGRTLIKAFPDIGQRAFVASPLSRATETMRRMRTMMGLAPDVFGFDDRLRELSFGAWEGFTLGEMKLRDPEGSRLRETDKWDFRPPQGESYADLAARVTAVVAALTGPAVVVAHGGVSRVLLNLLGGVDREKVAGMAIPQGRATVFADGGFRWV